MKSIQELIRLIQPVDDDSPTPEPVPSVPDRPGRGRFMVYVWAFEQRGGGRRLFDEQLEHCQDDIAAQDVLVPWVRTAQHTQGQEDVHHRCVYERTNSDYHLFREHELDELVQWAARDLRQTQSVQVQKEAGGWERGNWWGVWRVIRQTPPL